jgi:type IV secretory pathway ATPase VirB11/archaellum biosynthesis ATPase
MSAVRARGSSAKWWKKLRLAASENARSKPAFSHSWVLDTEPKKILDSKENRFVRTSIIDQGARGPNAYVIDPYEYRMDTGTVSILLSTMEALSKDPPPQAIMDDEIALRNYLEKVSLSHLGPLSKDADSPALLGRITAQYTAGYGVLEHLLRDERVQDIYIDSPPSMKPVYVSLGGHIPRELEGTYPTNIHLTERELQRVVSILRYHSGLPFSESSPVLECDLELYNARVTAVGPPLSKKGISIAIRKHSHDPWTLLRLMDVNAITPLAAAFLSMSIAGRRTLLIAGPRGAGKTSLLSSLLFEVDRSQRMIIIEDTPELPINPLNENGYKVLGLTVGNSEVSNTDKALRTALRLGESVLVLGEVRGPETKTLYEMMSAGTAGSSVLGTFHADSADAVYKRAVEDLGVSSVSFTATDLIVVAGLVQPKGKKVRLRRIVQIAEVVKDGHPGKFRDLFLYDHDKNGLEPTDDLASSATLRSIAKLWGMPPMDIVSELHTRSSVLGEASSILRKNEISRPVFMAKVSEAYHEAREKAIEKERFRDQEYILKTWRKRFKEGDR